MNRTKNWMGAAVAIFGLAAGAGAADNAGLMLGNAGRAVETLQGGLGTGVNAEQMAARGFEGQQVLQGLDTSGGVGAVDASKSGKSGFARFQDRHAPQAGLKADVAVPTPVGYDCFGPNCDKGQYGGGGPGNWGYTGEKWGNIAGRIAGLVLSFVAMNAAIPLLLAGSVTGFAVGAAVIAGTWTGRPEGSSIIERLTSSPIGNGMGKIGGFVGKWTGKGLGAAATFVGNLFRRGGQ